MQGRGELTFKVFYLSLERLSVESSFHASTSVQHCIHPATTPGKALKETLIGCERRTEAAPVLL